MIVPLNHSDAILWFQEVRDGEIKDSSSGLLMARGCSGARGLPSRLHFNDVLRDFCTNKGAISLNYPEPGLTSLPVPGELHRSQGEPCLQLSAMKTRLQMFANYPECLRRKQEGNVYF